MKSRAMTHRVFLLNPKKLLFVLLVFSLAFFFVQQKIIRRTKAADNAFYAANNGNNSRPGTESRPWKTIQKAPNTMIAGDTTYVREGTYDRNSGTSETSSSIPAFPGAEGFGANSVGGRGGRVIEVTNLNDSGSGSLRACIEAGDPRTCVFRTGGTIELQSSLEITNPFITIAGQTAPGGGITLKNHPSNREPSVHVKSHDVVIRYIRVRPGPSQEKSSNVDAITIGNINGGTFNVIVDHCSFSWATDEVVNTWYDAQDITLQWSIVSEGLNCSTHEKGCHSKGPLFGSGEGSGRISMHHNLMAHNVERNPLITTDRVVDVVNNIIYNPGGAAAMLSDQYNNAPSANFVGNYAIAGHDSGDHMYVVRAYPQATGFGFSIYVRGNIGPNRTQDDQDEALAVWPDSRQFMTSTRHDAPLVTTTSAFEAYDQVLAGAGATIGFDSQGNSYWRRDTVDERIVNDVRNGTGRVIDDPSEVGGWPDLAAGTPPTDTDHDGMADDWELAHFGALDRGSPDDSSSDFDGDGYTDLEEYLNGTNPKDNVPTPPTSSPPPSPQPTSSPTPVPPTSTPTPSPTPTPTPGDLEVYEAEETTLTDARVESNHPGYTGSGFVNYLADSGASIRWMDVNVSSSGDYTLTFRYALGKADRPIRIEVNGSVVKSSLNFPNTGGWSDWTSLSINAPLNSRSNTIEAVTIGYDGPNIDHLEVQPVQTQIFLPFVSKSSLP